MPIFFRGAGLGTYWWHNDARQSGVAARAPRNGATVDRLHSISAAARRPPLMCPSRARSPSHGTMPHSEAGPCPASPIRRSSTRSRSMGRQPAACSIRSRRSPRPCRCHSPRPAFITMATSERSWVLSMPRKRGCCSGRCGIHRPSRQSPMSMWGRSWLRSCAPSGMPRSSWWTIYPHVAWSPGTTFGNLFLTKEG